MKKRIVSLVVVGLLLVGIGNIYAGGVTDDNNGNKGHILISTGVNHGSNSVGHLTDVKDVPELKGEKGDIGLQGENGEDVNPETVTELQDTDTELNNKIDNTNINIKNNTKQIQRQNTEINNINNRVGKLEQTQYKLQMEFRVIDTKRVTISPCISHNFTRNKIDEVGVRVTVKLGKSYEEKLIELQNMRLSAMEHKLAMPKIVLEREIVKDRKGNVISEHFSISENNIQFKTQF